VVVKFYMFHFNLYDNKHSISKSSSVGIQNSIMPKFLLYITKTILEKKRMCNYVIIVKGHKVRPFVRPLPNTDFLSSDWFMRLWRGQPFSFEKCLVMSL